MEGILHPIYTYLLFLRESFAILILWILFFHQTRTTKSFFLKKKKKNKSIRIRGYIPIMLVATSKAVFIFEDENSIRENFCIFFVTFIFYTLF